MSHEATVRTVRETLCAVFAEMDRWFEREAALGPFKPAPDQWSVDEVLEHVTLTNHYLLLTLGKWVRIAEHRAGRGDPTPPGESDLERVSAVGEADSFEWDRPAHLEPTGQRSPETVRATLHRQLGACLIHLERIDGGVGALCRIRMSVHALGKIDLYQWLYFLAQHARRHLQQLRRLESSFDAARSVRGEPTDG